LTSANVIHIIDNVVDSTSAAASIDASFSRHYLGTPTMIQTTQKPSASANQSRLGIGIISIDIFDLNLK
jgi:hypothetical protein